MSLQPSSLKIDDVIKVSYVGIADHNKGKRSYDIVKIISLSGSDVCLRVKLASGREVNFRSGQWQSDSEYHNVVSVEKQ